MKKNILKKTRAQKKSSTYNDNALYTTINFDIVDKRARIFAAIIESRFEQLTNLLLKYESYEVVQDETNRTLDLLKNLKENKKFFSLRVGAVATFLPRNQPLYTFTCFAVVPSLMATEVHLRIPHSMRYFFSDMLTLLDVNHLFPNIIVSNKQRIEFLKERSALFVNPETNESRPVTDVVIFTGITNHADQLRLVFDRKTLFIANGAGHNPVIVGNDADIHAAVEAVVSLVLYNQGQDCSAPNAILVHQDLFSQFMRRLDVKLSTIKVGPYSDRSCTVGPISEHEDLKRIETVLVDNAKWLDRKRNGIIRTAQAIVEPTIICKPLHEGGNYTELFAPIFFVQQYNKDGDLASYFENKNYARNAMNISLYGKSNYINNIVGKMIDGRVLHFKHTVLRNTNPHDPGIERGTQQYGGYGYGTSSISINGKIMPMPTLPQRDIYEWIVKPLLINKKRFTYLKTLGQFSKIETKDVEKLLKLRSREPIERESVDLYDRVGYLDLQKVQNTNGARYIRIEESNHYRILSNPNIKYIATLDLEDVKMIRLLKKLISRKSVLSLDEFRTILYDIPNDIPRIKNATAAQNKLRQNRFFKNIYQLLLGRESGPKLAQFLIDVDVTTAQKLLDI